MKPRQPGSDWNIRKIILIFFFLAHVSEHLIHNWVLLTPEKEETLIFLEQEQDGFLEMFKVMFR